jgi:hypothetical protein
MPAGQSALAFNVNGTPAGMVRLFTATNCSTNFNMVACQAAPAAGQAMGRVSFNNLAAGSTYYMAVSGFNSNDPQGAFTIGDVLSARGELAGGRVHIFPNPVQGTSRLNVQVSGVHPTGRVHCQVLNALGQVVLTQAYELRNGALNEALDINRLAAGLYHVRLTTGSETVVQKVEIR